MPGGALREVITLFGFDVDKGSWRNAEGRVSKLKSGLANLARAVAGGVAANYLRNVVKETAALGDAIDKTAGKLGIGTAELQQLQYAGEISGVAVNTTNMALQRFIRRSAEAAQGTGEAKDALAQLGVKLTDSSGRLRPAADLLGEVAEGLKGAKTDGDRLRLAFKLFDSEGVAFVNLLKNGRGGLEDLMLEAKALGGVMNRDLIALTVQYTDEQTRLSFAIQGLKNDIVRGLLPGIIATVRSTIEWVKANRGLITNAIVRTVRTFAQMLSDLVSVVWALVSGLSDLAGTLGPIGKQAALVAGIFAALALALGLPAAVAVALYLALEDLYGFMSGDRRSVLGDLVDWATEEGISAEDHWLVKLLKEVLYLVKEFKTQRAELGKNLWAWITQGFTGGDLEEAGRSLRAVSTLGASEVGETAINPVGGLVSRASTMISNPTINQTVQAPAGTSPQEIADLSTGKIADAMAAENRKTIRALTAQGD